MGRRCRALCDSGGVSLARPDEAARRGTIVGFDRGLEEDVMMESVPLLDRAGRRRSPATLSSFHEGRTPRNKGLRYPPDPPTVEEIIAVMRAAGERPDGIRLCGVTIMLWRAGLRIRDVARGDPAAGDPATARARPAAALAAVALPTSAASASSVVAPSPDASAGPAVANLHFPLDGTDPIATGCANSAVTVANTPISIHGISLGDLQLRWSTACQTNRAKFTGTDGPVSAGHADGLATARPTRGAGRGRGDRSRGSTGP